MAFEVAMGLLLLHKQNSVRIGLMGTMGFLIGIAPLSLLQIPWLGLLIGEAYLFTKEFDASFLESIRSKLRPRRSLCVYNEWDNFKPKNRVEYRARRISQ